MSTQLERMAADACPGDTPYCLATTATANGQRITIPAEMIGKFCWFGAQTLDVFIRFGVTADSIQVDATQVTTLTGEAVNVAGPKVPHLFVPAGSVVHWRLDAGWDKLVHISSGTTGFLRFGLAQGHFGAES
jgi:hypothetical protein